MNNVAVVYWSGTGNTTAMAEAVAKGCSGKLFPSDQFDAAKVDAFDAIAFGCPSMGNEELEDSEFAPMFEACKPKLNGKKIALFGSYGWETASGCATGRPTATPPARTASATASSAWRRPTPGAQAACEKLGAALADA